MKKTLVLFSLLTLPCLADTQADKAIHARTDINYLCNSTGAFIREYLINVTLDLPTEAIIQHLLKNQEAIGSLFGSLYGKEKGKEISDLLKVQANQALSLINAIKKNDKKAQKEAEMAWKKNACSLTKLLDTMNPYLDYNVLYPLTNQDLSMLTKMATDRVGKKWEDDIINYNNVRKQLHKVATLLGNAFTNAFPQPKDKEPSPKPRVTVPLPPGTHLKGTTTTL